MTPKVFRVQSDSGPRFPCGSSLPTDTYPLQKIICRSFVGRFVFRCAAEKRHSKDSCLPVLFTEVEDSTSPADLDQSSCYICRLSQTNTHRICSGTDRIRHIHLSRGNRLEIRLTPPKSAPVYFVLRYEGACHKSLSPTTGPSLSSPHSLWSSNRIRLVQTSGHHTCSISQGQSSRFLPLFRHRMSVNCYTRAV